MNFFFGKKYKLLKPIVVRTWYTMVRFSCTDDSVPPPVPSNLIIFTSKQINDFFFGVESVEKRDTVRNQFIHALPNLEK